MDDRDAVLPQPRPFRSRPHVAEWAYFHHLHTLLLLGDGNGLLESLEERVRGLRCVYLPRQPERDINAYTLALRLLRLRHEGRDARNHHEKNAAALRIFGIGAEECIEYTLERNGGRVEAAERVIPYEPDVDHPIGTDGEFSVRYGADAGGLRFELRHRCKRLHPTLAPLLAELGITLDDEGRSVGSAAAKKEFGRRVAARKKEYVRQRSEEMLRDPSSRPADFEEHSRNIVRELSGRSGNRRQHYASEDLLARTVGRIALTEATNLAFAFTTRTIGVLSSEGYVGTHF